MKEAIELRNSFNKRARFFTKMISESCQVKTQIKARDAGVIYSISIAIDDKIVFGSGYSADSAMYNAIYNLTRN